VFGSGVLAEIFGPKWGEVGEDWLKPHCEKKNGCTYGQIVIKVAQPGKMKWAGHVARMKEKRNVCNTSVGKLNEGGIS
jgi:hypothetical protein